MAARHTQEQEGSMKFKEASLPRGVQTIPAWWHIVLTSASYDGGGDDDDGVISWK